MFHNMTPVVWIPISDIGYQFIGVVPRLLERFARRNEDVSDHLVHFDSSSNVTSLTGLGLDFLGPVFADALYHRMPK
jgi:hypothetical protein